MKHDIDGNWISPMFIFSWDEFNRDPPICDLFFRKTGSVLTCSEQLGGTSRDGVGCSRIAIITIAMICRTSDADQLVQPSLWPLAKPGNQRHLR